MSRKQPARKKKRPSSNIRQPIPTEAKKAWSRGDILALIGIAVAVIGLLISLTIPEVRQFIGLDHPTSASKPHSYPHLWKYYLGFQQILPENIIPIIPKEEDKKNSYLILYFSWETPLDSSAGKFVGYLESYLGDQINCTLSGSMDSPDSNNNTQIMISCAFSANAEYKFSGDVYPDGHISGYATKSTDQRFVAYWHFVLPGTSAAKGFPTPAATNIPEGPVLLSCLPPPLPCSPSDVQPTSQPNSLPKNDQVPICNTGDCPNYALTPTP